jgi:hypothetical protein
VPPRSQTPYGRPLALASQRSNSTSSPSSDATRSRRSANRSRTESSAPAWRQFGWPKSRRLYRQGLFSAAREGAGPVIRGGGADPAPDGLGGALPWAWAFRGRSEAVASGSSRATHERARELPSELGTAVGLSDEGGGMRKAQGDAPRTARRAYHASSMGGDPPRRPSSREGRSAFTADSSRSYPAHGAASSATRRSAARTPDRSSGSATHPRARTQASARGESSGLRRRGGRPAQRTVRGHTGIHLHGGGTIGHRG